MKLSYIYSFYFIAIALFINPKAYADIPGSPPIPPSQTEVLVNCESFDNKIPECTEDKKCLFSEKPIREGHCYTSTASRPPVCVCLPDTKEP